MRIIRLRKPGGLDALYTDTLEPREPRRDEIQIRVHATTLNFHDYAVVSGGIPAEDGRIPMSDASGVISAVGSDLSGWMVGDHVISTFFPRWTGGSIQSEKCLGVPGDDADGFASEYVTANCQAFTRAPAGYSHPQAASLPCAGLTAWRALMVEGDARPGQTVLVQGTGGVSLFAMQFARMAGCRVIATSSSNEKLERLGKMGADHLINYKKEPDWGRVARKLSGGNGVHHVIETGGAGTLDQSIKACRNGGHIALIGVLAGLKGEILTASIMLKQIRLIGITVGSREHQLDMISAIEANRIEPVMDKSFPLEELADAFRYQESGAHFGKIAVEY